MDFGIPTDEVLASFEHLNRLKQMSNQSTSEPAQDYSMPAQILRHGVTHFQCTPSLAGMLLQDPEAEKALRTLKTMLLGGEAFPSALAEQLQIVPEVINMYGPTETTIWSPAIPCGAKEPPSRSAGRSRTRKFTLWIEISNRRPLACLANY